MQRIILDTDLAMGAPGSDIDDGFALALAHADEEIQLDLITTVNGNTDVESATLLTLELRRRLGIDVPIYRGASTPFCHPERVRTPSDEVVANYGVGLKADPGYAAVEMVRHVMANPGEVTVVAIGPLTNVAAAILLEPAFAANVKELVIMGGIFLGTMGHRDMAGEFNVWVDPEAAEAVLRSGVKQRWVGLDVTLQVRLTREHARRLIESPGSFAQLAGESTLSWIDFLQQRNPGDASLADSCAMHDPLAVAAVTHPELLTWRDAAVSVVTGDGIARGVMVPDLLYSAEPPSPNCTIATAVDADGFTEFFLRSLASL
ncbi:MAG: nucleoside hydrolase [Humibacter sp.]